MNFDDLQRTWQAQPNAAQVTIPMDALLKQVRRNQQSFLATIFWRDVREVGVCAWLTWLFTRGAIKHHDWSELAVAFSCFGVGVFMLADRWLQHRRRPLRNDSLRSCLEASLVQVSHQIWLLKNVWWWYLLPLDIAMGVFFLHAAWIGPMHRAWERFAFAASMLGIAAVVVCGVSVFVYWLNQFAVRKNLEPRRHELEALLASLEQN